MEPFGVIWSLIINRAYVIFIFFGQKLAPFGSVWLHLAPLNFSSKKFCKILIARLSALNTGFHLTDNYITALLMINLLGVL
jgi:hypothetical protein